MTHAFRILHYSKYLALFLVVIGIPIIMMDKSYGAQMPLLIGLFMLLVTTDKIEDERSVHLKITSLYFAFIISYTVKLLTTNLSHHNLTSFELVEIDHFIILVLGLANSIFYGRLFISRFQH